MSTGDILIQPMHGVFDSANQALPETLCTVSLSRSINADRRRLFQALTVAEFIETWFRAPDATLGSVEVSACFRSFQIRYRQPCGIRIRFVCAYRVLRRSKVQFTWTDKTDAENRSSLVTVRLQGDFGRTILTLTHAGLSQSDYPWHRALWEDSIEKFARLF